MKTARFLLIGLCVVTGAITTHAQGVPLMLRVIKNESTATKDRVYIGDYSRHTTADSLSYLIEVTNAGQTPLEDIQVKWAILLKPRGEPQLKLVEGTKTIKLGRSEKDTVETDPVQTRQAWRSSLSSHNYGVVEEVGHSVEVIHGGKTIASEFKPMNIKPKIDAQRAADQKETHTPASSSSTKKSKTRVH
jgi:hypothetical protein